MDVAGREFPKRPPREPLTDLGAIVRDFTWRFPRERRDMVFEFCCDAPNAREAIRRACQSRAANGKMHNHQSRVPQSVKDRYQAVILRWSARILERLAEAREEGRDEFDALHDMLEVIAPEGIGPVTTYDVATRIGAYLDVHPTSLYLHAGVRQGIVALDGGRSAAWRGVERVPAKELHARWPDFTSLPPDEVEDLVCTYREVFKEINKEET